MGCPASPANFQANLMNANRVEPINVQTRIQEYDWVGILRYWASLIIYACSACAQLAVWIPFVAGVFFTTVIYSGHIPAFINEDLPCLPIRVLEILVSRWRIIFANVDDGSHIRLVIHRSNSVYSAAICSTLLPLPISNPSSLIFLLLLAYIGYRFVSRVYQYWNNLLRELNWLYPN